jgi:hypothetical protein
LETTPLTTGGAPTADIRGSNPGQATPIPGPGDRTLPDSANSTKPDDVKLTVAPPPPATNTSPPGAVLLTPKPPSEIPARLDTGSNGVASPRVSDTATGQGSVAQPIVQTSANENQRRIGAAPTVSTPAISVPIPGSAASPRPTAPSTPKVDSWDEETYRAKAGDTFERISTAHFNTDKYADALRRFNVTHPQANDKMRADPATLEAGEAVYIPPAYILEKRYGVALIPGYKPPRESTPANDTPRTANSSPRSNSAVTAEAANYKLYRVSPSGQNMREIARAALGNAERWKDIYNLNPTLDPAYAVRGSMTIKVPAEANVPAANVPPPESR